MKRINHSNRSEPLRKLYARGKTQGPGFYPHSIIPTISGDPLTGPDQAFRAEAAGYWFKDGKVEKELRVHSRY